MTDRMDQLTGAAARQGFAVWQTRRGSWVFKKGSLTVIEDSTPTTAVQWVRLVATLRELGLVFPEDRPTDETTEEN